MLSVSFVFRKKIPEKPYVTGVLPGVCTFPYLQADPAPLASPDPYGMTIA